MSTQKARNLGSLATTWTEPQPCTRQFQLVSANVRFAESQCSQWVMTAHHSQGIIVTGLLDLFGRCKLPLSLHLIELVVVSRKTLMRQCAIQHVSQVTAVIYGTTTLRVLSVPRVIPQHASRRPRVPMTFSLTLRLLTEERLLGVAQGITYVQKSISTQC